MNEQTFKDTLTTPLTDEKIDRALWHIRHKNSRFRICTLAYSICGRRIPYVMWGEGQHLLLYVAVHHAMEWLTGNLLLAFLEELSEDTKETSRLYQQFRFVVIPCLNPDGVSLVLEGANPGHVLYQRQVRMNEGSTDFSHWQANARGVDLNHNYSVGFHEYRALQIEKGIYGGAPTLYAGTYPESEPETSALCGLVRMLRPSLILTLHTQGEEIFYDAPNATPSMHKMAEALASLSKYQTGKAEGTAAYGGLTEWAVRCGIPSFTIECGKGENPLPASCGEAIYEQVRQVFFCAPQLSLL